MHFFFINVYIENFQPTNVHKHSYVLDKLSIVYINTTNLKRVLQMTFLFINDNIRSMSKIPYNSQCTDPIFSNLFILRICCLLCCFLPSVFFFYNSYNYVWSLCLIMQFWNGRCLLFSQIFLKQYSFQHKTKYDTHLWLHYPKKGTFF